MRALLFVFAAVAALVAAVLAPGRVGADEPEKAIYADPVAFGPENVAFPWFAAFSPDGKWVGFSDGTTPYVEIWDAAKGVRAWPTDGKSRRGTHRVSFSAKSDAMAFVDGTRLVVVRLVDGAWKEKESVTLPEKPPTSLRVSPLRLDMEPSGLGVLLATGEGAVGVDLTCGCIEKTGEWKDVVSTFSFPDGTVAVGREKAFVTHIIPHEDPASDAPGVLLQTDAKGTTWLVASDKSKFDLGPPEGDAHVALALEIRDAGATKPRASFELTESAAGSSSAIHRLLLQAQFSPDVRLLATVEGTGVIVLRDAATAAPLQTIRTYQSGRGGPYAMGVAFAPDGERLITGGRQAAGPSCLVWKRVKP